VRLYAHDLARLHGSGLPTVRRSEEWHSGPPEEIVELATKRDSAGRRVCVALSGLAGGACSCGVYENRPEACRRFEVGGPLCVAARQRLGLPVEADALPSA